MMGKAVYVDGKPVIDFWNVSEYNDAKRLEPSKVADSPLPFLKIYGKKGQKLPLRISYAQVKRLRRRLLKRKR
uniref:Uncharacterized protein n=1 Tax=Panagrolaimus sp. JU765 TaxID=591449 RepID=A0AC34QJ11_9BILA